MSKKWNRLIDKTFKPGLCLLIFWLYSAPLFAAGTVDIVQAKSIGDVAHNIVQSFQSVGQLLIATGYLAGISLVLSSMFKFKMHRENPTQVPMSTPISLLLVGIVMMFLPGIIAPAGLTLFGGSYSNLPAGGFTGNLSSRVIPGSQ